MTDIYSEAVIARQFNSVGQQAVKFCHREELATKQSGNFDEMALSLTLHAMAPF